MSRLTKKLLEKKLRLFEVNCRGIYYARNMVRRYHDKSQFRLFKRVKNDTKMKRVKILLKTNPGYVKSVSI